MRVPFEITQEGQPRRATKSRSRRFSITLAVVMTSLLASAGVASAAPITETQEKLYASDATTEVGFGRKVAIDGNTALVSSAGIGPMSGQSGQAEVNIGSVYVFVRDGDTWTEQAKIMAEDGVEGDGFGSAIAISGNIALIASPSDDNRGEDSGSVYMYQRAGSTWTLIAHLWANDASAGDYFGSSVAIDGHIALVSAPGKADVGARTGAVYAFTRPAPDSLILGPPGQVVWSQEAKLVASDADEGDSFGTSIALSGATALIGAYGNDDAGADAGSAYIFRRDNMAWSELQKLTASDASAHAFFGASVALSNGTALIGAPAGHVGAAYIFGQDLGTITSGLQGAPPWVQHAKLTATTPDSSADFGTSVAIAGTTAAVGAWAGDAASNVRGSVHLFSPTVSSWSEHTVLTAVVAPGAEGVGNSERFGGSIAMSGETLFVGSGLDDDIELNSGAAYVFAPKAPKVEKHCETSDTRALDSFRRVPAEKPLPECPRWAMRSRGVTPD